MEKENKKGSMTAKQLVSIILLVMGFAILLFIFYQINWSGQIDKQVCHQSVVLRATAPTVAQSLIPLKCKTSKICVSSGIIKGKCEKEFENTKGITKAKVNDVEQIEKLVTQEVIDCWTMMGEGKVSLFSQFWAERYGFGGVYPSCVICSRIAFDEKLDVELDDMNVFDYMRKHKIPDGEISYYDYLTSEGGKMSVSDSITIKDVGEEDGNPVIGEGDSITISGEDLEEPFEGKDEMAILFMQISAPTHKDAALNLGKDVLGIGIGSFVGFSLVRKVAVKAVTAIGLTGSLITLGVAIVSTAATQQIGVAHSRGVTAGYCGDVSVGQDARNGCSIVRTVKYNATEIEKYCSVLENIS